MNSRHYTPRSETDNRNNCYKLLQVGKTQLCWDNEFYYGIFLPMHGATLKDGRYSASTMSIGQLFKAVEYMKSKGFRIKSKRDKSARKLADDAQSQKIRALWLAMHSQGIVRNPSEASLNDYVKRLTGIEALQWLTTEQASSVIEVLKQWQKRCNNESVAI